MIYPAVGVALFRSNVSDNVDGVDGVDDVTVELLKSGTIGEHDNFTSVFVFGVARGNVGRVVQTNVFGVVCRVG